MPASPRKRRRPQAAMRAKADRYGRGERVDPTPEQMARGCHRADEQVADFEGNIGLPWHCWKPMLDVYADAGWIQPHHREAGEKMIELAMQAGRRDIVSQRSMDGIRRGQGDGASRAASELREIERAIGPRYLKAVDMVVFRNLRAPALHVEQGLERASRHLGVQG